MKILIIEDDPVNKEVVSNILSTIGDVQTASNAFDGIQFIRQNRPDVIILDIVLPGMDGRTFLELPEVKNIPIVVMTADSTYINSNVRILLKPFNPSDLIAAIKGI